MVTTVIVMAIISSFGALKSIAGPYPSFPVATSVQMYDGARQDYAAVYHKHEIVKRAIDFPARNIAQLGIHVFQRVSDNDRLRLIDHPLARVLNRPNPWDTRYELVEHTVQDFGIHGNALWLKVRATDGLGLVQVPWSWVTVQGGLRPLTYTLMLNGREHAFDRMDVVHFKQYDPSNPLSGMSKLEALRPILGAYNAGMGYLETLYRNGAAIGGIIERPKEAPKWGPEALDKFRRQWQEKFGGYGKAGGTPVLSDGMTFKPATHSAREAQVIELLKWCIEQVGASYDIPLPLLGILDHATFSNIEAQHKHLYQDALGPTIELLQSAIELQLLTDPDIATEDENVYVEMNIAEKLKGSFDDQARSIQTLTGCPVMTRNEARARLNLPRLDDGDADQVITPLNVTVGSPSGAPVSDEEMDRRAMETADRFVARQESVWRKSLDNGRQFDRARWSRELMQDIRAAQMERVHV